MTLAGAEAAARSVNAPQPGALSPPSAYALWWPTNDELHPPPWGVNVYQRDHQLVGLMHAEPFLASAVASVAARNAAFSWSVTGDDDVAEAAASILNNAEFGRGWVPFAMRLATDLLTQDLGAFVEIIRSGPKVTDPVVGIATLPSQRCFPTGNPEVPVIFVDRRGKFHKLKWYQAVHLLEMPLYHPQIDGLQLCAISRALLKIQTWSSIETYEDEKVSGRYGRAIHLLSGVTRKEMESATNLAQDMADARGMLRYQPPVILPVVSDQPATIATLELASLPDGFEMEQHFREYLTLLAMAFLAEYQEFAPLPSGNIGTGTQSDTLDQKAKLKGAAIWRKLIAGMLNNILPDTVQFTFDESDVDEMQRQAEARKTRAEERQIRLTSGEIDEVAARELAVMEGDLTEEQAAAITERKAAGSEPQLDQPLAGGAAPPGPPANLPEVVGNDEGGTDQKNLFDDAEPSARDAAEEDATGAFERILGRMFRRVSTRLNEED